VSAPHSSSKEVIIVYVERNNDEMDAMEKIEVLDRFETFQEGLMDRLQDRLMANDVSEVADMERLLERLAEEIEKRRSEIEQEIDIAVSDFFD
jgi:hypothetical protein